MSDLQNAAGVESSETQPRSSTAPIRQVLLVGLLVLMLAALWYDYRVARPAVETAFNRIARLNEEVNSKGGKKYLTDLDVQKELNRTPIETFVKNHYYVEVYGWRSGLPTKHHKYFAIYTAATPHALLTHEMNMLSDDIMSPRKMKTAEPDRATGEPVAGGRVPGGPRQPKMSLPIHFPPTNQGGDKGDVQTPAEKDSPAKETENAPAKEAEKASEDAQSTPTS